MSKAQAFTTCALFGGVTLLMIPVGQSIGYPFCGCFGWLFLTLALVFGYVGVSKVARDAEIAKQQIAQRAIEPRPGYGERAQPTTPGSSMIGLDFSKAPPSESV